MNEMCTSIEKSKKMPKKIVVKHQFDDKMRGGKLIRRDITRSNFYQENTEEQNRRYFSTKGKSFLHGIDNIYYSVFIKDDDNEKEQVDKLVFILSGLRDDMKLNNRDSIEIPCSDLVLTKKKFSIYEYNFGLPELYDVFLSDYLPNKSTPRIVVQIRSMALWLYGYDTIIKSSFNSVEQLLRMFGMEIECIKENRIDYCYHTNSIQSPAKHFSDKGLEERLSTTFNIYHKVGQVFKSQKGYGSDLSLEYVSLGERKSNNLFFRIYDKTLEVIEQGYKSFFIELWYQQGLISMYDKYCFEYAYKEKNYDYIHKAKLHFYLQYGTDHNYKKEILAILNNKDCNIYDIRLLADKIMPDTSTILNIEYETRRKFYYTAEDQILNLPCSVNDERLTKLYKIIQNRNIFINYLTDITVSFRKKDGSFVDWWDRLRNTKIFGIYSKDDKLLRVYSNKLEIQKIYKSTISKIAAASIYNNKINSGFIADISDLLANINDNDIVKGIMEYRETGIENIIDTSVLSDYRIKKEKKYKALKSRLQTDTLQKSDI